MKTDPKFKTIVGENVEVKKGLSSSSSGVMGSGMSVPPSVKLSQEKNEREKKNYEQLVGSAEVQKVFKDHEYKLTQLFEALCKHTFREVSRANMSDKEISFKTFNWFFHKFNIHPEIINDTNEILVVYNVVQKSKTVVDFKPIGNKEAVDDHFH